MALIDLKTDLKNLKYSDFSTRVGPAIQKDVNNPPAYNNISKQATARTDDLVRMTRLIVANKGSINQATTRFLGNQALISSLNAANRIKKGDKPGKALSDGALDPAKAVRSFIQQVPVAGTGTHFIYGPAVGKQYLKASTGFFGPGGIDGASLALEGEPIILDSKPESAKDDKAVFSDYTAGNEIVKSIEGAKISDLNKGKKGRGSSFLTKEDLPTTNESTLIPDNYDSSTGEVRFTSTPPEDDSTTKITELSSSSLAPSIPSTIDKEVGINGKFKANFNQDYSHETIALNVMGKRGNFAPKNKGSNTGDSINMKFDSLQILNDDLQDIIPFEIIALDPAIDSNQYIYFRAYLDSFNDSYNGEWGNTKYIGRADELYNYTGFSREISFDFKIAAMSKGELSPLYEKLNFFVGTTAPSYSGETFMRGVFCRLQIGDYLKSVPGFFTSINLSWDSSYPWQIINEDEIVRNPMVLNVATNFQPVHTFNPAINEKFIGTAVG